MAFKTIIEFLKKPFSVMGTSVILSLYTLIAFHAPFFRDVTDNVQGNFNGVLITVSMIILMFTLNFFI